MTHDAKVLALLSDGKPHTHHELYALHVIAHSRVSSLRAKGHLIEAWRDGDDYLYQLVSATPRGGEPQADHSGLDALRWVDASSPPPGADAPSAPDYEQLELLSAAKDAARVAA